MLTIKQIVTDLPSHQDKKLTAQGWFRYIRKQKNQAFAALSDGTSFQKLQCVFLKKSLPDDLWQTIIGLDNGSSVQVTGTLIESPAKGQTHELQVETLVVFGQCDQDEYPLSFKKGFKMDHLRQYLHLRARVEIIQCIMRIRSTLDYATHQFFQQQGYLRLHTPLITSSDCEGAGEVFEVSSDSRYKMSLMAEPQRDPPKSEQEKKDREAALEAKRLFFGKKAFLTVSGQLDGESYATAMSRIYTFGPTFRAENSVTYRHLAEFWMIEPEMAFMDLFQNMQVAQDYVQFCVQQVLEKHQDDLKFLEQKQENPSGGLSGEGLVDRLTRIAESDFPRVSYTRAIELLQPHATKFEEQEIVWGMDMASEHEKFLVDHCFDGQPIIVYNYPSAIKSFYMYENDPDDQGRKTVAAMDMLVPGIGELIGGSQREDRYPLLLEKIKAAGLDPTDYQDYLDLRKYGNVPHSGFGLGFERLVMLATATHHIRDTIPFPRAVGLC